MDSTNAMILLCFFYTQLRVSNMLPKDDIGFQHNTMSVYTHVGQAVLMSCDSIIDPPPMKFSWTYNTIPLLETGRTLNITPTKLNHKTSFGIYSCRATNIRGNSEKIFFHLVKLPGKGAAAKSRTVKSEFAAGIAISIIVCVLGVGIFYLAIFGGKSAPEAVDESKSCRVPCNHINCTTGLSKCHDDILAAFRIRRKSFSREQFV